MSRSLTRAIEVFLLYMGLVPAFVLLVQVGLMQWQESALPYPFVTEIGVLVLLPTVVTVVAGRNLEREGMAIAMPLELRPMLGSVVGFTWLSTFAFLVLPGIGETYSTPLGSAVLALAVFACGTAMLVHLRRYDSVVAPSRSNRGAAASILLVLLAGVGGVLATSSAVPVVGRLFGNVCLTAFCEEYFFRGYVQGALDTAWPPRWRRWGIVFGPGLFAAAILFGLFHLIPSIALGRTIPWAWAIWTGVFGIFAGALRMKTGTITLPWVMHGTLLAVRAFGGG